MLWFQPITQRGRTRLKRYYFLQVDKDGNPVTWRWQVWLDEKLVYAGKGDDENTVEKDSWDTLWRAHRTLQAIDFSHDITQ